MLLWLLRAKKFVQMVQKIVQIHKNMIPQSAKKKNFFGVGRIEVTDLLFSALQEKLGKPCKIRVLEVKSWTKRGHKNIRPAPF